MPLTTWLETIAAQYARTAYRLALILLAAACAFIAIHSMAQPGPAAPSRLLRGAGKGLGELAGLLAAGAMAYYLLREAFVRLLAKNRAVLLGPYLKAGLTFFRLLHPALGLAALALAGVHSYILWLAWGGLAGGWPVLSGLALAGGGAALAAGGAWLRVFPGARATRRGHRLLAFLAVLLFVAHKIIAD
jgi:hypothetical protein